MNKQHRIRCSICGRFISCADMELGKVGLYDPTGPGDYEYREPVPFHKSCEQEESK